MSGNEGEINASDDSEMSQESWDNMSVDAFDEGEESDSSNGDVSMQESNTNDSSSNSTSSVERNGRNMLVNISRNNFSVRVGRMRLVRRQSHYSDEDTQYTYSDRSTEGYTAEEDSAEDVHHDVDSDTSDTEDVQQTANQDIHSDIEDEQQNASNERQVTENIASSSLDNAGRVENINNDISNATDEAFSCPICLEGLTNIGPHRPACLKCGHIFGENCLIRWIKVGCRSESKRCPSCNTKANLKDIRVLYAKHLVAVDVSELTALEIKLSQEVREKNLLRSELDRWKSKCEYANTEINKLRVSLAGQTHALSSSSNHTSNRQCLKKINLCKTNAGCRVMAFSKSNMLLVVSQHSESPLFNSHIIRKVNALVLEPSKECIYAHKKQIRDMTFHPFENNLLASVSLDKCINLSDIVSNMVISSVEVEEPLWSCCWAGDNSNMLIAGSQFGSLYYIDRRFMKVLKVEGNRKPACVSLAPLLPSRSRKFINGGFLKTRMDLLSVFEHGTRDDMTEYRETELPLKGLWSSTSYNDQSNLILSSAKPCGANKSIRHIVSKISDFNEEGPIIHPVVTFYGGDKATQLSRSCIIPSRQSQEDTLVSCYDEKSSQIKLFSVNSSSSIHNFPVIDKFLDLCNLDTNDNRRLAGLSENSLSIFAI